MLSYRTAGESHGRALVALVEGFPAGLRIDRAFIDGELRRRQQGYGRGERMKIEADQVRILSGIKGATSIGTPIALLIRNRDYRIEEFPPLYQPLPGHADLPGAMKLGIRDSRIVRERSSARDTAARVAAGALAKLLLSHFGIEVVGYVVGIGKVRATVPDVAASELVKLRDANECFCPDSSVVERMKAEIDRARAEGDTVGGVVEVSAFGVPPGLGGYAQWDEKLDGRLARALMSIQAVKGVEVGLGFGVANKPGSEVHDEIFYDAKRLDADRLTGFYRRTNNAGGIEGGVTNGEPIVVRAAVKPIPTLGKPLASVNVETKEPIQAGRERADVSAVVPASVIAEAVVGFEIAAAFLQKFGGDSVEEVGRNYQGYLRQLRQL